MPLTMRPTGLGSGHYKDVPDYGIYCGEWCIGRIYETRTGPPELRWFWALHVPSKPAETIRTDNRTATLEQAKAQFEASWKQSWKAWTGMEERPARKMLGMKDDAGSGNRVAAFHLISGRMARNRNGHPLPDRNTGGVLAGTSAGLVSIVKGSPAGLVGRRSLAPRRQKKNPAAGGPGRGF
jgi:hypothetical protein